MYIYEDMQDIYEDKYMHVHIYISACEYLISELYLCVSATDVVKASLMT